MKTLACALALAGGLSVMSITPHAAYAAQARAPSGLQLSVLTPDPGSIGDRMSLDVTFRGGAVETVELYLDNALVAKRQLGTAQSRGVITFTLDTILLAEGSHEVQVKAYGADGRPAITRSSLRVAAADLSAPVRIAYPQNGIQVSGTVPVRVHVDTDLQKQKPYVTFFVNKELRLLRNYPPYEYSWDTTRETNGWHLLEAWTQGSDALTPYKARGIHVNVNNAGGATKKQDTVEDLRSPGAAAKPIVLTPEPPRTGAAAVGGGVEPVRANTTVRSQGSTADAMTTRTAEPGSAGIGTRTSVVSPSPSLTVAHAALPAPSPRMMGGAAVQPDGGAAKQTRRGSLPGMDGAGGLYAVVAPGRAGSDVLTVKPGETLRSIGRKAGVDPHEIARLNNLPANTTLRKGSSLVVPQAGAFEVAFNGTRIAFDVPPRVEAGIKLAPFRQIFEYTGGRLYWFGGRAKTVRAVNNTREVEIHIGNADALVNNQTLTMERTPYIDCGRTIVPLTFIRDALSVKVSMDPASGRLLIESR